MCIRDKYKVEQILDYRDPDVFKYIEKCDTVFMYDVPVERRRELVEYCYRLMKNIYFNHDGNIDDLVSLLLLCLLYTSRCV